MLRFLLIFTAILIGHAHAAIIMVQPKPSEDLTESSPSNFASSAFRYMKIDYLACGKTLLRATSDCVDVETIGIQCYSQVIDIVDFKDAPDNALPSKEIKRLSHDGNHVQIPFIQDGQVLDSIATQWACVQTINETPYILIGYQCQESDASKCPYKINTWTRLFDVDGEIMSKAENRNSVTIEKVNQKLIDSGLIKNDIELVDIRMQ